MQATITRDMTISDILKVNPNIANILMGMGMHCLSCPSSQAETLEEAAAVHGVSAEVIVREINEFLEHFPEGGEELWV